MNERAQVTLVSSSCAWSSRDLCIVGPGPLSGYMGGGLRGPGFFISHAAGGPRDPTNSHVQCATCAMHACSHVNESGRGVGRLRCTDRVVADHINRPARSAASPTISYVATEMCRSTCTCLSYYPYLLLRASTRSAVACRRS